MSSFLNFKRVAELPVTIEPSTMYIVKSANNQDLIDIYVSNKDGSAVRHVINESDIQNKINIAVSSSLASFTDVQIVANIAGRNALNLTSNGLALVLDATADATVGAGAAMYVFNHSNTTWYKVAEYESMDVTLLWDNLVGRPVSPVADIDDAVAKRHTHANMTSLNKISEDGDGNLMFDGKYPKVPLEVSDW